MRGGYATFSAIILGLLLPRACSQGLPSGFSDAAKDLWGELTEGVAESAAAMLSSDLCEIRQKLLKEFAKATAKEAPQYKAMLLREIGMCDMKAERYDHAKKRFVSAISEMNAPEEALLKNTQFATFVLYKDGTALLESRQPTKAATAWRRSKTILFREKEQFVKKFAKGNKIPEEHVMQVLQDMKKNMKGQGDQAQQARMIIKQLNQLDAEVDLIDVILERIASSTLGEEPELKEKSTRLKNSLSGPHVLGLATEIMQPADDLEVVTSLLLSLEKIVQEVQGIEKHQTLLKRTKDGSGCKALPETCAMVKDMVDAQTNGFGESRVLLLKAGKAHTLDVCETNANLALIIALDSAVTVTVGSASEQIEAQTGVLVDHCVPGNLLAEEASHVLVAQVWHPQFAPLERTTETRTRAKKWSLSEDEVTQVTKAINAAAKKEWESTANLWAEGSAVKAADERFTAKAEAAAAAAEAAKQAKEKSDMEQDEERKRGLQELEKKREAKQKDDEVKEKKRKELEQRRREEEAKKDPWLLDPAVVAAKEKLEELKEARRDANAKLEFDLTTSLTKDISAQERQLEKTIKKAKKAHKKGKTVAEMESSKGSAGAAEESTAGSGAAPDAEKLKAELQEVEAAKAKAAAAEDFAEAKRLKKRQSEIKEQLKALEGGEL
mmetsp:Transcript_41360/g.74848  ORF Transcript_41360/g.74848 Transcript_41360/m.74848 type:complete len:667 (-) Transcript_41360:132-2132(-)